MYIDFIVPTYLYKEIANMYFKSCHTQASSEKLALFIKLLKNKAVDGIEVDMPILSRIFVDDFEQIFEQFFRAYIVTSTTIIEMKTNIMISKVEHQYNINLDEVDKKYLSHWIEKKLNHP
jgi:chromatin segregation and condensation protein Rec8/ScpA/Scc1 (kleisin family)